MPLLLTDDFTFDAGTMTEDAVIVSAAPDAQILNAGLIGPDADDTRSAVDLAAGSGSFRNIGTVLQQAEPPALRAGTAQFDVINTGQIAWLGETGGVGLDLAAPAPLTNDGTLTAVSASGSVTGLAAANGLTFVNTGHVETQGSDDPVALDILGDGQVDIINSGSIHAVLADVILTGMGFTSTARDAGAETFSTAIRLTYEGGASAPILIDNRGEMIADRIIDATGTTATSVRIENSGLMAGTLYLGDAAEVVRNTGLITGTAHLGGGNDVYDGGMGTITGPLFGGDGDDTLTIGSFAVPVYGGAGDDIITGAGDIDVLSGGAGNDVLDGGVNVNQLHGGSGDDILHANSAGHEDFYGGTGADLFIGSLSALHLDRIHDLDTEDTIRIEGVVLDEENIDRGKIGRDTLLHLGPDTDLILTGRAKKLIISQGEDYTDIAFAKGPKLKSGWQIGSDDGDTLTGLKGSDRLDGLWGNDHLYGEKGADTLNGGAGNDLLDGGKHDDTLAGEAGHDILTGGKGRDTFLFDGGHDRITDFRPTQDQIGIMGFGLTFDDLLGAARSDADGYLVFTLSDADSLTLEGLAATTAFESDFFFG